MDRIEIGRHVTQGCRQRSIDFEYILVLSDRDRHIPQHAAQAIGLGRDRLVDSSVGGALVTIGVAYSYQTFRDRFIDDQSRNAIFSTAVFLRNTQ